MKNIDIVRKELRTTLRNKRNQLSTQQQHDASIAISNALLEMTSPSDIIALYLANDGEISPNLAIQTLQQQQRKCLLPVMHGFKKGFLNFQLFETTTPMIPNAFGILEPKLNAAETVPLEQINYIFMPLVGFDDQGNRMGMGGGFYDRTLAQLKHSNTTPHLIGLAHDCQQVKQLPVQNWDIPLQQIITPTKKITPIQHL